MESRLPKEKVREQQKKKLHNFFLQSQSSQIIENICQNLFKNPSFVRSSTIGVTMSMSEEFPTTSIIHEARKLGKQIVIPRTLPRFQMEFVETFPDSILKKTKFGVLEPVEGNIVDKNNIELLIVPGLAFSKDGYRLGYGAGFYDRFLTGFSGKTISLATPVQIFDEPVWQLGIHDVKIQKIIYLK